jgi:hypothetical protein
MSTRIAELLPVAELLVLLPGSFEPAQEFTCIITSDDRNSRAYGDRVRDTD